MHVAAARGLALGVLLLAASSGHVPLAGVASRVRIVGLLLLARGFVGHAYAASSPAAVTGELLAPSLDPAAAVHRATLALDLVEAHLVLGAGLLVDLLLDSLSDRVLIGNTLAQKRRRAIRLVGVNVPCTRAALRLLRINLCLVLGNLGARGTT